MAWFYQQYLPDGVAGAAEANLEQILASLGRLMRSQAALT
jgi:hypothetical protein